jgi:23S rRNA pseudouridine1911/1915/1917 synthase
LKTVADRSYTLIGFLIEKYPDSPRTRIKKLLQNGTVFVNDKSVTLHSYLIKPGDIIEINLQAGKSTKSGLPFPVLYEDPQIIIIDKPAGSPTSSIDGSTSIQDIISEHLKKQSKGRIRAHVVHRLDKEVSGVLLFAKSREVMDIIKDKWKETEKHYYALVEGIPEKTEDTIKSWLIEDNKQKVHSTPESANARFAVTNYKITELKDRYSLLDITTDTGRKNQIRVHLSDIGCPIVGDWKYGASKEFIRRIRLHAYSLSFPHPVSGKKVTVNSPMPKGFLFLKAGDEKYKSAFRKTEKF